MRGDCERECTAESEWGRGQADEGSIGGFEKIIARLLLIVGMHWVTLSRWCVGIVSVIMG